MSDAGFADTNVVRLTLRRIRVRVALDQVRASAEALSDLLDQQRQALPGDGPSLAKKGLGLSISDNEGGFERGSVSHAERHALRENELLQGVKLVAQLLDRIDIGIRHGLFSSGGEPEGKGTPEELADLEASENLHRRPLGPIERAAFTAALVTAAQERIAREHGDLDQYQRGARARWDRVTEPLYQRRKGCPTTSSSW